MRASPSLGRPWWCGGAHSGDRMFEEVTPDNLARSSPGNVNVTADVIHAAIYDARPDVHAIVHHHTTPVVAVIVRAVRQRSSGRAQGRRRAK